MYSNLFKLESVVDSRFINYNDMLLEYHEQDVSSSTTVTTKFDVVHGTLIINNSDSAMVTALTDCVVTDTAGVKTITVTGTATKFFLVGEISAVEAT